MTDRIVQLVGLFFFGVAVWLIMKEVEKVGLNHLETLILSTPLWIVGLGLLFTLCDYLALSGYDFLALRYVGKKVPLKTVFKTAGVGFAISNTTGHAYVAGGSVRYLFYTKEGLTKLDIVKLIAFESLTFLFGMLFAFFVAVLAAPLSHALDAHYGYLKELDWVCLIIAVLFACYWILVIKPGRKIKVAGELITSPSPKMTIRQILVGFADNVCVILAFYVLMWYHLKSPFLPVFIVFIIAQAVGVSSQVPGGIGVFEGLFLYLFPHTLEQKGGILASLAIFRVLYYFVPFVLAAFYLVGIEAEKFFAERRTEKKKSS